MDKLLIIGSTGLVGSKVAALAERYGFEAYNTHNARDSTLPRSFHLDISDHDSTMRLVEQIRPDAIVNTAALHNVDYCETHREEAFRVNVEGVKNLAEAARSKGCRLIHLSTDYVFDGSRGPYGENDLPIPLQYYAQTKLQAEKVASQVPSYVVARPSVIYGWNPLEATGIASSSGKTINFAMFVLDKLKKEESVVAIRDQYSSPTFADDLAQALLRLAKHRGNGIFHTAGRSCVSRYEFSLNVAEVFGYPSSLIRPIWTSDLPQVAPRPKNTCLRVGKAESTLGLRFLTVQEGLTEMKEQGSARARVSP